jgi:hypothetical protein
MLLGRQGAIEGAPMTVARTPVQTDETLDAARALALDALRLGRLLPDSARWPRRWRQPAFGVEVERVRRHLARIRSHEALAASYGREVFDQAVPRPDRTAGSAVRVGYALRWLELRDGATGPSWQAMID